MSMNKNELNFTIERDGTIINQKPSSKARESNLLEW